MLPKVSRNFTQSFLWVILFQCSEETEGGPWSAVSTHGPWTHHAFVRSRGFIDKGVFKGVIGNLQARMLPKPTLHQKEEWRTSVFLFPFIYSASTHFVRDKARMLLPSWGWHPFLPSGSYIQGNQRHGGEETDPGNFQLITMRQAEAQPSQTRLEDPISCSCSFLFLCFFFLPQLHLVLRP